MVVSKVGMFTQETIWLIWETTNWLAAHSSPSQGYCAFNNFPVPFSFFRNKKPNPVRVCLHVFFLGTKTHQTPMMKDDHQLEIDRRKIDEEETQTSGWKINAWCNKNTLFPQRMVQWKNGLYLQDERFLYTRTILIHFSTPQFLWEGYPPGN